MKSNHLLTLPAFARRTALAGLVWAASLAGQFAPAAVVVDTTNADNPYSLSVIRRQDPKPKHWIYQAVAIPFQMPAANYTLDSIVLHTFGPNPTGTMAVDILANSGSGTPGAVVTTITRTGTLTGLVQFNSTAHPLLLAGNTYWVAARIPPPYTGTVEWMLAFDTLPPGKYAVMPGDKKGLPTGVWQVGLNHTTQFQINGTLMP